MGNFHYRARDSRGVLVRGEVEAPDSKTARKKVAAQGLIVLSATESPLLEIMSRAKGMFAEKVSPEAMIMFSRQMQIIYTVGIPIIHGMQLVLEQTLNPSLREAIAEIIKDISEGQSLHSSMTKHNDIFDDVYVNLIRVGETTGQLGTMLERSANLIEERSELQAKVKSATFYPKLVVGFFTVVLLFVVYFALPRMRTFFDSLGTKLPLPTRIVMGVSDAMVNYWYIVFLLAFGGVWAVRKALADPKIRLEFDRRALKFPVFGVLFQQIEVNSFCVILELLLRSGVSIVEAFHYVEKSASNVAFANDIAECRRQIEKGSSLAQGLSSATTFPNMIKGLIGMGEEGGKLPDVLKQISGFYRLQIEHRLDNLTKLIEPILLVFIFGLVLTLALAVFMPMWQMSSALKH
jgi:MSHA biogenesis protein MshG